MVLKQWHLSTNEHSVTQILVSKYRTPPPEGTVVGPDRSPTPHLSQQGAPVSESWEPEGLRDQCQKTQDLHWSNRQQLKLKISPPNQKPKTPTPELSWDALC